VGQVNQNNLVLNQEKGNIKMAMKESHKLAIRRLKASFPSLSEGIVGTALEQGMTEGQIRKMLKAAGPDKKVSAALSRVKGALDKPTSGTTATTTKKPSGGQRAADALARIRSSLAKPTDRKKSTPVSKEGAAAKRMPTPKKKAAPSATNKGADPAKKFNVGVSSGGVPFKEAFAHFRKKGAKTFTWNGKKYTTKLKSEKK
jgi:hypothetical protein